MDKLFVGTPTVEEIRATIEAVPCGECEGSGIIHVSAGDGKHSTDFFQSYDEEPCPTCKGTGVINEWERFVHWVADEYWGKHICAPMKFADALSIPELLIQAYLSWKEIDDAG